MADEERSTYRPVILLGSENYSEWSLSISTVLMARGLLDFISSSQVLDSEDRHKINRCFAYLIQSLSSIIVASLPALLRNPLSPDPAALWKHLKRAYSAAVGARQAALVQELFRTTVQDGQNPLEVISRLQSAHSQLVTGGESISDSLLAYAMTLALPESWTAQKQALWMEQHLSSEKVASTIRAEWQRRQMDGNDGTALFAKPQMYQQKFGQGLKKQGSNEMWCDLHKSKTHTNAQCSAQGGTPPPSFYNKRQGNANLAQNASKSTNPSPPDASAQIANYESDGSAFTVSTVCNTAKNDFIIDSGASHHMVTCPSLLANLRTIAPPKQIKIGDGKHLAAPAIGTLQIGDASFGNAFLVPQLASNLISVGATPDEYKWDFSRHQATLYNQQTALLTAHKINDLFTFKASRYHALSANSADPIAVLKDWHQRLGHLNVQSVMRLFRAGRIDGLDAITSLDLQQFECKSCILGKGKRIASLSTALPETRSTHLLDLVHVDLWGPATTPSMGGKRYFLTCYDDYSHHINLYFLASKSDALGALKEYATMAETQTGRKIKQLRSDGGGEFTSNAAILFYKQKGIEHLLVPPGSHQQNGRVERVHLTILNLVRTYLTDCALSQSFWAEAASYAAYIRNRTPCKPSNNIPDDLWYGKTKSHSHLQPFGCKLYYRRHHAISKLEPRYSEGILMGYIPGTTSYRVWDIKLLKIIKTRDVVFPHSTNNNQDYTLVDFNAHKTPAVPSYSQQEFNHADDQLHPDDPLKTKSAQNDLETLLHFEIDLPVMEQEKPPDSSQRIQPSVTDNTAIRRSARLQSIASQIESENSESDDELLLTADNANPNGNVATALYHAMAAFAAPNTYLQARHSPEWNEWNSAMANELAKMDKYKVWDVVDRQPSMRVVGARWVYTRKIDGSTGLPSTYKARWVAKGFSQIEGIDYNELYAAVAHKDTIRVFLSLVNYFDLECDQVDIVAAFLNGNLQETIYMDPPEGSELSNNKVLQLRKSIYGLKQSPRCFNKAFDKWLKEQNFKVAKADSCLYTRVSPNGDFIMLSIHVDDQLIASNNRPALDKFKQQLNAQFECADSGAVGYFLGFNVHRNRDERKLYISQEHYMESLLDRFNLSHCNPSKIPLPSGFRPIPATDKEFAEAKHLPYPQIVGSILYASTISRPDLSQPASVLSRFISKWNDTHYQAAKHLLRYIRGTTDLCLVFDGNCGKRIIQGYADADWGGDLDTRRSTTGYIFKVYGGTIAWKSRRQPTVALSTTEAEYMASADAARQATWLRLLLDDLQIGLTTNEPISILNDNNGCIALSKNPVHHERSKHIAMRHHFLREKVEDHSVKLDFIPSADNLADMFTKALPQPAFEHLKKQIGISKYRSPARGEV